MKAVLIEGLHICLSNVVTVGDPYNSKVPRSSLERKVSLGPPLQRCILSYVLCPFSEFVNHLWQAKAGSEARSCSSK